VWKKKNLTSLLSSWREKPNLEKLGRALDTETVPVCQACVKSKSQVYWARNRWRPLRAGQENDANTERGYENRARGTPCSQVGNRHEKPRIGERDCKLKITKHWGVKDQPETEADWPRSEQELKSRPVTTKSKFHECQSRKRISRRKRKKQRTRISDPTTPGKKDAQHH
jgi:hypothetical protein